MATWGICYHAQQSLEKGLKALLVATGADPPRSHNLVRLNAAVDPPVFGPDDEDDLIAITGWAVLHRYPADLPEPTPSRANEALAVATRGLRMIAERLKTGDAS